MTALAREGDDQATMQGRWLWVGGLVSLALIGLILRLHHLGHDSLWIDEINVVTSARAGAVLASLRQRLGPLDPPLSYLLIAASLHLPLPLTTAARLPAAMAGGLEVVATGLVIHTLSKRRDMALVGAGLVAVAPFAVRYGQEAHYYSMFSAVHLLSWWALISALRGERRWRWWMVIAACALYVHVFAWVVLGLQLVTVAVVALRRRRAHSRVLRPAIGAAAIAVAAALPWALYESQYWVFGGQTRRLGINAPHSQPVPLDLDLFRRTAAWTLGNSGHLGPLAAVLLALALLAPVVAPVGTRRLAAGVLIYAVTVVVILVALARLDGTYLAMRRVEFLGPVLLVSVALAVAGVVDRIAALMKVPRLRPALAGATAGALMALSLPALARYDRSVKTDWRAVARRIRAAPAASAVVIGPFSPNWYFAIEQYLQWLGVTRPLVHIADLADAHPLPDEVLWITGAAPRLDGLVTTTVTAPPRAQVLAGDRGWGQINLLLYVSTSTPSSGAELRAERDAVARLPWTIPAQ